MDKNCDICDTRFEHDFFMWIDDKDIEHLVCSECHWDLLEAYGSAGTPEAYLFKER